MYKAVTARPAYKAHRRVSRHPWPSGMLAYFSYMADAPAAEADRFPHRATSTPTAIPGPSHCRAAKRRRSVPCLAHPARRFGDTRADRGSGTCCIHSVRRPRMRETEQQEPSSSLQTRSNFSSITGSVNAMRAPSPGHASGASSNPCWIESPDRSRLCRPRRCRWRRRHACNMEAPPASPGVRPDSCHAS